MQTSTLTLTKALKAGAIAGLIGAGLNNIWSLIAGAFGTTVPPGFAMAVTITSLLPVIIGSAIYFVLARFLAKGLTIWYVVAVAFTLLSFMPVFNPPPTLPDGTVLDSTFPILVGPMHVISGALAAWGIPRWGK
jgi:hypothetical protein